MSDTINIVVAEDEDQERSLLSGYIQRFAREQQINVSISEFSDGAGLVSNYRGDYDIILMDIQMEYMDGMTAAQKIRQVDESVIIIFITNLAQYAIHGYSVGAMNFILKPISYFAFNELMRSALQKIAGKKPDTVLLHCKDGLCRININDVIFIETVGRALKFHTKTGEYLMYDTLSNLEKKLNDNRFFRCHRAYLINLYFVERVKDHEITINEQNIPLSRYKKKLFEDALTEILGNTL